ncbi:MAG: hypothetical protein A2X49_12530 [Lentisphaerae bacterium GWF2_52_8]|nr:MAG: hypothetical protein A2X49_12530 [Lentisphaerae bacterium GWF2_52_8]
MKPSKIFCLIPSTLGMGDEFNLNVKILGDLRVIESASFAWSPRMPKLAGPFNRCTARNIQYLDNVLPAWSGKLLVEGGAALEGAEEVIFDGTSQGVFTGDTRPIRSFGGFRWKAAGFQFIKLIEPVTGVTVYSNPVYVSEKSPSTRIVWGDPHWQTFFSDGIRIPEELYAFARDEAFLDFGAISDHMEAISARQWDYFQAVSNDYNESGRFATLIGQEWTHHKCGHRNIYYRGNGGPALRSNDSDCDSLEKLWQKLDSCTGIDAIAIPHHSANLTMGVDWGQGWNPKYERAVEIHSCWGSSECHKDDGNIKPITVCNGELKGQHVRDALNLGYKMGFVGAGDIHDGRPGDSLSEFQPEVELYKGLYPQGLTAASVSALTRENVFDAMKNHNTYATTHRRIFLDVQKSIQKGKLNLAIKTASEDGIKDVKLIFNGNEIETLSPDDDPRIVIREISIDRLSNSDYCYVRTTSMDGDIAWSSPFFA